MASRCGLTAKPMESASEPLLREPWIPDTDVTVKPLYGYQEGTKNAFDGLKNHWG